MDVSKKEVGTFVVTEVSHRVDQEGHYSNSFKGVMSGMKNIPMNPCPAPIAGSQLAWVKSNADEKKLGRVKVQMQWQKKNNKTTNWIRIQTPDAGPNPHAEKYKDIVTSNRGLVAIPEEGDLVMLGFEYGDPDRPYVAGSIFSEKASRGGKENNKIKSYTTRVGSTVTFDDDEHTIEISTSKRNKIFIEEKKGAITISSSETIDLNSNRITLSGRKSISLQSPKINIGDHKGQLANNTIDLAGAHIKADGSTHVYIEGGGAKIHMENGDIKEN
jgi:uncharacterized protein involved in type VI secretion and phage assembly